MKISIVTTCLNSEKSIAFTLSSVLEQTHKDIEHIIIDGGSTDGTLDVLHQHKREKKIQSHCRTSPLLLIHFNIFLKLLKN